MVVKYNASKEKGHDRITWRENVCEAYALYAREPRRHDARGRGQKGDG